MSGERARALLRRLESRGVALAEVLVKRGRTRRSELGPEGPVAVLTDEEGWALRAGGTEGSFFCCGTGTPPMEAAWPTMAGEALRLPEAGAVPRWRPGPELEAPLMVEGEARRWIEHLEGELRRQIADAVLLRAELDDGASETRLVSSRGIDCEFSSRAATLRVEAVRRDRPETRTSLEVAARGAQRLEPRSVVRRLADILLTRGSEPVTERERGDMILAPAVGARLLAALMPLWIGPDAARLARSLGDRHDRLASQVLSVADDGRFPGGVLAAPVDGEGVATGRVLLVDRGRFVQPVVDWRQAEAQGWKASGCQRRPGWRDLPRPGTTHLHVVPVPEIAAADLVAAVARGFYWLDTVGPVTVDFESDRFAVEVCGFGITQGRARQRVGRAWLCGGVRALLRGVRGVARDLELVPAAGLSGSPTMLVAGLEVRRDL